MSADQHVDTTPIMPSSEIADELAKHAGYSSYSRTLKELLAEASRRLKMDTTITEKLEVVIHELDGRRLSGASPSEVLGYVLRALSLILNRDESGIHLSSGELRSL